MFLVTSTLLSLIQPFIMPSSRWKHIDDAIQQITIPPSNTLVWAKPTLMGLPAEIRVRICKLVVVHEEGGGVISPIERHWINEKGPIPGRGIIFKGHTRFYISFSTGQPLMPPTRLRRRGHPMNKTTKLLAVLEHRRIMRLWNSLPNHVKRHVCTPECLRQPPLSKVSSQLRRETLAEFYGSNKFHFEMRDLVRCTPVTWARAVGDTNLRLINKLNIHEQHRWRLRSMTEGRMFRYRRSPAAKGPQLTESIGRGPIIQIRDDDTATASREIRKEQELRAILQLVSDQGLHVTALETIAKLFVAIERPLVFQQRVKFGGQDYAVYEDVPVELDSEN